MSTQLQFELNGNLVNPPVEWRDIELSASFDQESIQANIDIESFTFVNQVKRAVDNWIASGLNNGVGIFEGMPFKITAINSGAPLTIFDGHLDLTNELQIISPVKLSAKIAKDNALNSLNDLTQANSFSFLESEKSVFTNADYFDVQYVVERENTVLEVAMLAMATYQMVTEIYRVIKDTGEQSGKTTVAGIPVPTIPPAPNLSAIVFAVISLAILVAYFALMIIAVKNLITTLVSTLISPVNTYKGIKVKTALTKALSYFGYTFQTNITELDNIVYLPSKPTTNDSITKGIPKANDKGYLVSEMMNLVTDLFKAKVGIVGNTVVIEAENDAYWQLNSTYQQPDVLVEDFRYNTEDLKANKLLRFEVDPLDEWTLRNFQGTNYEVITSPLVVNDKKRVKIKGLEEVRFGVALGNRKDSLNTVENILKGLAGFADSVVNLFGGNSNLQQNIKARVGMLKVSGNTHQLPKVLYYNGSSIPSNHRDLFKAKTLHDKYHVYDSFVQNNYNGQKLIYSEVKIPFTFSDFIKLTDNSFFTTYDGKQGKMINIRWNVDRDYAICDFWVRQIYTKNLEENGIEPV